MVQNLPGLMTSLSMATSLPTRPMNLVYARILFHVTYIFGDTAFCHGFISVNYYIKMHLKFVHSNNAVDT